MNRKIVFGSLLVCLLALGLGFVSCDNGTPPPLLLPSDPTDDILEDLGLDSEKIRDIGLDTSGLTGAKSGDYVLIWGGIQRSYVNC